MDGWERRGSGKTCSGLAAVGADKGACASGSRGGGKSHNCMVAVQITAVAEMLAEAVHV